MGAVRRLTKELQDLKACTEPGPFSTGPLGNDLFNWEAILWGPEGTPYEGGLFFLSIQFPENYPFKPPKVTFKTRIYHPNIHSIFFGSFSIDTLQSKWSPRTSISKVLLSICDLLNNPKPDDPKSVKAAHAHKIDRDKYIALAKKMTKKYAM